jgi:hypothetical protein
MTQGYPTTAQVLVAHPTEDRNYHATLTVENVQEQSNWGYMHKDRTFRGEIEWNGTHRYVFGNSADHFNCAEEIGQYQDDAYQEL